MTSLGTKIRDLRHARNLTLEALGGAVGITKAHLSDVELGRRNPSAKLIKKLAGELGVREDQLEKFDSRYYLESLKGLLDENPGVGPEILAAAKKIAKRRKS